MRANKTEYVRQENKVLKNREISQRKKKKHERKCRGNAENNYSVLSGRVKIAKKKKRKGIKRKPEKCIKVDSASLGMRKKKC